MKIAHHTQPVVFIADLHLSTSRSDISKAFQQCLQQLHNIEALYIMGDLFEVWLGEDCIPADIQASLHAIEQASQKFPIFFCTGNRDFLLSPQSAKKYGMTPLPDVQPVDLFGVQTLVMHGDTLCTEDTAYQRFSKVFTHFMDQRLFLASPKAIRNHFYRNIKAKSQQDKQTKTLSIMDVTPSAVTATLNAYQAQRIIHGHTHRPYLHQLDAIHQRWVVGDWDKNASLLIVTPTHHKLMPLSFEETACLTTHLHAFNLTP